jgi:hypothetical protein
MKWAGHAAWMGRKENEFRILIGDPEDKGPLEIPRRKL